MRIEDYLPLAESCARSVWAGHGQEDDIRQEAVLGLMDAAQRFDPARGNAERFLRYRIYGRIRDYMRHQDSVSRRRRQELKRSGDDRPQLLSIDRATEDGIQHADRSTPRPDELAEGALLRARVARLPEPCHTVIMDLYWGDAKLSDVSRKLGKSDSWVCQLRTRALRILAKQLRRAA